MVLLYSQSGKPHGLGCLLGSTEPSNYAGVAVPKDQKKKMMLGTNTPENGTLAFKKTTNVVKFL